ncbi:MAG: SDR family NAD(P)-dependent oxidoreductase [Leptospirales bacterium]|nr:SDR family NAD(P)-dependent oxidoreductase [Leptospirales bacterium]
MKIQNTIAVVLGASQGIGKAIALELASRGATVALLARSAGALKSAATEAPGGRAHAFVCDVSKDSELVATLRKIEKQFGRIDILVNNAGVGTFKPLHKMSLEEATAPVQLPLRCALVACHTVLPGMRSRKGGQIVNLTSPSAYFPFPYMAPYLAARHAMLGLSLALREELRPAGIGVSLICPGHVDTGYFQRNDADIEYFPRIEKLFPVLTPVQVAKRTAAAIEKNQREAIFPGSLWFITRFFQTFPRLSLAFLRVTGLLRPTRQVANA